MNRLVSVVMPAYNAERTIRAAIDSALRQTYACIELVIVDDASHDDTVAVIESYDDPRIRLFKNAENSGEGATRDRAIAESRGEWIAVLDADDAWAADRIEKMTALDPGCSGDVILVDNIMLCFEVSGNLECWKTIRGNSDAFLKPGDKGLSDYVRQQTYLIKPVMPRSLITRCSLSHSAIKYGADAQFFIRLLKLGGARIRVMPEALYLYRLTPGAVSGATGARVSMKNMLLGLCEELDFSADELAGIRKKIRVQERHIEYEPFGRALQEHDYIAAIRYGLIRPRRLMLFAWRLPKMILFYFAVKRRGGKARSLYG